MFNNADTALTNIHAKNQGNPPPLGIILWRKMPSKKHFYCFFQCYPLVTRNIHLENGHGGIRHLHTNVSKQSANIWTV